MCDICGSLFCDVRCPSYDGFDALYGRYVGSCDGCGEAIHEREDFFMNGSLLFCADCSIRRVELTEQKRSKRLSLRKGPGHTTQAKGEQ